MSQPEVAFYCVADERYFLGLVGLLNSLRLLGHDEPAYVLDCGLAPSQRERLAGAATLVESSEPAPPWLLKTVAPLRHPARVQVLIDADVVVTRHLGELIDRARAGRPVAFRDRLQRHFREWGPALGLGDVKPRPYVSSAFLVLGADDAGSILPRMEAARDVVDFERTHWRRNEPGYPFLYADQDVLNAILAAGDPPREIESLDSRLLATPPFRGLRVRDTASLECEYPDGARPFGLHHFVQKPWLEPVYHSPYSRLLARLLLGDDVAVPVPEGEVPLRMRDGVLARLERARVNAMDLASWGLRERFGLRRAPGGRGDGG